MLNQPIALRTDTPMTYWSRTRAGTFLIRQQIDGLWHVVHQGEDLGSYATAQHALDDLAGGHTFWPSSGIDPSTLGLPEELGDWNRGSPDL